MLRVPAKVLTFEGFESLHGADEEIIEAIVDTVPHGEFLGTVIITIEYVEDTDESPV